MKNRRLLATVGMICLALTLLASIILVGCAKPAPTPTPAPAPTPAPTPAPAITPKYGGTLTMLDSGGVHNLGSVIDMGFFVPWAARPALESLLSFDSNGNIVGLLAESYDVAPDGKSITLHLHKNVKFHDGTDFNADAVKYNLEAVLAANIPGSAVLKKVTSYEILDPYTLRINLSQYDFRLLVGLAQGSIGLMISPTAMEKPTTPENMAKDHLVSTGAFMFDSWQRDGYVKYVKNPNYWQPGKPYLDAIQVTAVADMAVGIMAFKSGEGQFITTIGTEDAAQLKKDGYAITYMAGGGAFFGFVTDGNNPDSPFADKRVREALDYAIDREAIVQGIGNGIWEPLYQGASKDSPWYDPSLTPRMYDTTKAKQLLADAGYPNGFNTTLTGDVRGDRDVLTTLVTYLKDVGITAELSIADVARGTMLPRQGWEGIFVSGFPFVYPGTMSSLYNTLGDPTNFVSMYRPAGWQDKWDALVAQIDDTQRIAQMKELNDIMYNEANAQFTYADYAPAASDGTVYQVTDSGIEPFRYTPYPNGGPYQAANIFLTK
jgi:peptide/nickel transport system substrate-binding protein